MNSEDLKHAISARTLEFEVALSLEKSYDELRKIYTELKDLKFQLVQIENNIGQSA